MQPPKLGRQTFLKDNVVSSGSPEKFIREIYDKETDDNPRYTGRYFLVIDKNKKEIVDAIHILEKRWGLSIATTDDFISTPPDENKIKDADAFFYNELGVALISIEEKTLEQIELSGAGFMILPEKVVYIPDEIPSDPASGAIWGIQITGAHNSLYTGNGIKVAILDTGFDVDHPDFRGREITASSFVPDETIDDLHGHGTHCIGTACGSVNQQENRYGIASNAHIFVGKVLNNQGSGAQSWILNGIAWAANNGCKVLSMSFGSRVSEGESYDIAYERAARFALSKGTFIVAAAGNDSRRSKNRYSPVSSPADCPSILAVAAIDRELRVGDFSNRAAIPTGLIDIAAPGVEIYSSWPMPVRYRTISGTSMATPHVAGIAALYFEKFPDATPAMIENELRKNALSLPLPAEDVGEGLSIAP